MRAPWLAVWFLLPAIAFPQTAPTNGDIYESGMPQPIQGTPQPIQQAFQKLYQITAQITADPSSFYLQAEADKSNWPAVDQAQAQWDTAMGQAGTALTQDQRNNIVPCVAHLNSAIDEMKRGYIIQKTQQTPLAERTVVILYGEAKQDFAKCLSTGVATDAGSTPASSSGTPSTGTPVSNGAGTPGTSSGGTPTNSAGGTPGNSNGGTPTNNSGGTPGNTPGSGTNPTPLPPDTQVVGFACPYDVQNDPVTGAAPPLRYTAGFNQAVAKCLQQQCTWGNLAAAVWAANFPAVRVALALNAAPTFIDLLFNRPGYTKSSDPYTQGTTDGATTCTYLLKVAQISGAAGGARATPTGPVSPAEPIAPVEPVAPVTTEPPVIPASGEPSNPPGFNPEQAATNIAQWIKQLNPTGCKQNCGIATVNAIKVMFGQLLQAAPRVENPEDAMTKGEMQQRLGTEFTENGLTDEQMNTFLNGQPDGTVSVIAGRPNAGGTGHFFWSIKLNGTVQYWDAQAGTPMMSPKGGPWNFDINIVGNPFQH